MITQNDTTLSPAAQAAVDRETEHTDYRQLYLELIEFVELLEAQTNDRNTSARVREFFKKEGLW